MTWTSQKLVKIYTDGACSGNPGKGGIGIILMYNDIKKELFFGYKRTTNNRMELLAVIIALEQLKGENIVAHIYSDSKYVIDAIEKKWLAKWLSNNFNNGKIKNQDLWLRYQHLAKKYPTQFHWIKGHATNPFNNRCDELAVMAYNQQKLLEDIGFKEYSNNEEIFL